MQGEASEGSEICCDLIIYFKEHSDYYRKDQSEGKYPSCRAGSRGAGEKYTESGLLELGDRDTEESNYA